MKFTRLPDAFFSVNPSVGADLNRLLVAAAPSPDRPRDRDFCFGRRLTASGSVSAVQTRDLVPGNSWKQASVLSSAGRLLVRRKACPRTSGFAGLGAPRLPMRRGKSGRLTTRFCCCIGSSFHLAMRRTPAATRQRPVPAGKRSTPAVEPSSRPNIRRLSERRGAVLWSGRRRITSSSKSKSSSQPGGLPRWCSRSIAQVANVPGTSAEMLGDAGAWARGRARRRCVG